MMNCASVLDHVADHRHERQLALRRQRRFRFVQQIQSVRHEPRLKQLEKALSVRILVEVHAVPLFHVGERRGERTLREPSRIGRSIGHLDVDPRQLLE